ncbi:hypothetical protein [Clostridium sp.]|uniref:hypothetical protein n=1 Tax=Clostridium sp. TaxID=1506 RepID=UPI001B6C7129|nr:hypothetical protein [Clostridium sp.]MBP3914751.1 hypothetical protein [Clostridium sp.]
MFNCFSEGLFKFLVSKDFTPTSQRRNFKDERFFVWEFKDTMELRKAIEEYMCLKEEHGNDRSNE